MRDFIWLNSSPPYFPCGQGQWTESLAKRGMMCQWQWSMVWPATAAVVDDHVEPVGARGGLDGAAEPGQKRAGVGGELFRELAQVRVVSAWYEQRVPGLTGLMSRKATAWAVSSTRAEGISPRTILQKMQCGSCTG